MRQNQRNSIMIYRRCGIGYTHQKLLVGDFNARVGGKEDDLPGVTGGHGIGKVNENAERLREFCMGNDLAMMGTFFRHQDLKKWTWMDSGNKGRMIDHCHMIDHVLVEQKRRGAVEDVRWLFVGRIAFFGLTLTFVHTKYIAKYILWWL
jgi:hypothetical protein